MDLYDIWSKLVRLLFRSIESTQKAEHSNFWGFEREDTEVSRVQFIPAKETKEAIDTEESHDKPESIFPKALEKDREVLQLKFEALEQPRHIITDRYGLSGVIMGPDESPEDEVSRHLLEKVQEMVGRENQKSETAPHIKAHHIIKTEKEEREKLQPFIDRAKEIRKTIEALRNKPKINMIYFVMYDIENDKVRKKIADYLEEKGLRRVQKSIFLGESPRPAFEKMREVLAQIQESYENHDSIFLVPLPEDYLKSMYLIGKEVDFELTLHRTNTVFI